MINTVLKYKTIFWCLVIFSVSKEAVVEGACLDPCAEVFPSCVVGPSLEIKTGYFFFSDSKMRKVYDKGGVDIQVSASYPIKSLTHEWVLNAYGAVEYLYLKGNSINGDQKTSLWSVPFNIGLKPVYTLSDEMQYYFSFGPRIFYIQQQNYSSFVDKRKSDCNIGFFINTGFIYRFCDHFLIDIFGEYSYAKAHFHTHRSRVYTRNIQVGGFTFGGGLGYEF